MRGTNRTRAAIREGLKLLLLLVLFYAIQDQIHGVRYDIYGNHLGLAEAQSSYRRKFETAFEDYSLKLTSAKVELEKLRSEFQGDQEDFRNYLDDRSQDLKGSILSRLQSEQDSVVGVLTHLEGQLENLEKLSSSASPKDLGHRKEKMIFPTAQLRGNGTVGSGVIIYSEPQPEFGNSPPPLYSTFVLTAYHVVVEILGDQLDRSIRSAQRFESYPGAVQRVQERFDRAEPRRPAGHGVEGRQVVLGQGIARISAAPSPSCPGMMRSSQRSNGSAGPSDLQGLTGEAVRESRCGAGEGRR